MTTALVTTQSIGSREELTAYANRIGYMVKGGNKLNDNERMALAQVALATGLNPFIGELWYIPGSGPMVGIAGARKLDNQQVTAKGGYTWEESISVDPEEAGASPEQVKNVAAAFRVEIHDSAATAQYQALFSDTLKMLRESGSKDPFAEAKEICGPRPVWYGYGFALSNESSRMSKPQLARKRAHADALKKRIVIPFGGQVSEHEAAPGYDVDAEAIDMEFEPPKDQEESINQLMGTSKAVPHPDVKASKRETQKPDGPVGILIDLGVDNTNHAANIATKLKMTSKMSREDIQELYSKYLDLKSDGKSSDEAAAELTA